MENIVVIISECTDIEELRSLGQEWLDSLHADAYGMDTDIEVIAADLEMWLEEEGTVLVAKEEDEVIGLIAVFAVPSYLGKQKIAVNKYWYVRDGYYFAGPKLYVKALEWARSHECSHLLTSGSKMASDRHDSICRFLEKTGAKHFETSYVYEIRQDEEL